MLDNDKIEGFLEIKPGWECRGAPSWLVMVEPNKKKFYLFDIQYDCMEMWKKKIKNDWNQYTIVSREEYLSE